MRSGLVLALTLFVLACSKRAPNEAPIEKTASDAGVSTGASRSVPKIQEIADLQTATQWLMKRERPLVIGVGEYHQVAGGPKVTSALHRFTREMFDILAQGGSTLVLETWAPAQNCAVAERVEGEIEETIQRPESTEGELDELLRRSEARRMSRLVLPLHCGDYQQILAADGVDYDKLLRLLGERLYEQIEKGYRARRSADMTVIAYGGSLHNDRYPYEGVEAYSYASRVLELTGGRYLELDLYVPELIENDELLRGEAWFPEFRQRSSEDRVLLVRRGEGSYILVLERTRSSGAANRPNDAGTARKPRLE